MAYLFTRLMDLDDSKAHLIARRYLRTDCNHSAACSVPPGTISLRLLPYMVTSFLWCPIFHVCPCMAIKVVVTSYSSDTRWSSILFRINFLCVLPFYTSDRHIDTYQGGATRPQLGSKKLKIAETSANLHYIPICWGLPEFQEMFLRCFQSAVLMPGLDVKLVKIMVCTGTVC